MKIKLKNCKSKMKSNSEMRRCLLPKYKNTVGKEVRLFVAFNFGKIICVGANVQQSKRKQTADGPKNKEFILGMTALE